MRGGKTGILWYSERGGGICLNEVWNKRAAVTVTVAGAVALLYLFCRYVTLLFLPFLLSAALALLTRPAVLSLSRRTGWSVKKASLPVTAFALLLFFSFCVLFLGRVVGEMQRLVAALLSESENPQGILSRAGETLRTWLSRLPRQGEGAWGQFGDMAGEGVRTALSRVATALSEGVLSFLRSLPAFLFFLLVTLISAFYVAADYERIGALAERFVPPSWREKKPALEERVGRAFRRYLRVYFLLFCLTFAELWFGFLILRVRYALLLAFLTAVLDILPVLGVGTVLLPAATVMFLSGRVPLGVGLLVLYAVITVVRQVTEPHLLGKSFGLHPLLMLTAFYAGVRLFGFAGIFMGPLAALLLKSLFSRETV